MLGDEDYEYQTREAKAWRDMCATIQEHFGLSAMDFNRVQNRPVVAAIEKWGDAHRQLRNLQVANGKITEAQARQGVFDKEAKE